LAVMMIALLGGQPLLAQAGASEAAKEAAAHFQAKEWAKAAEGYEKVVKEQPANGRAWFRLGISRNNLEQYEAAAEAFQQAQQAGFAVPTARYNAATSFAHLGKAEEAFHWLQEAVTAGFNQPQTMETDEDLAGLREDARFAEVLQKARVNATPCEYLPEYRQFDFWIGDWDVYSQQGQKVGTNRIEKMDNGCVLLENWVGAGGGPGKSLNYYDHTTKEWVQVWVGGTGNILPARGGIKDGSMYLEGTHYIRTGSVLLYRGTWTPLEDGRVRQFLERSRDDGKTWNVWFDGLYVRKEK
jgi:tetratricopeptide (TPR) repeat protein